jgi:hypothetical protein
VVWNQVLTSYYGHITHANFSLVHE